MRGDEILLLGIGIQPPWQLVDQYLDTSTQPHKLYLQVEGERGARYPCPQCGALCPAHDFTEKRWRHLNFFQHECYISASVPRVKCPKHGVHLVEVPWARKGSAFTLLFEQAALALVREMPVLAAARLMGITDTRLWRITQFLNYAQALVGDTPRLEPVRKALATLKTHARRVVQRWTSTYTNAWLEGFNGLFQAARARARGYRNTDTFIAMIYLTGSPAGSILKST